MQILYVVTILLQCLNAVYSYEYEERDQRPKTRIQSTEDLEFEPVMPITKNKEKLAVVKNINCDDFSKYALNCTVEAALIYNSSRKSPPMPAKVNDWCRAIRHLTNCAIDWNSDCKDVTESHFNEESIRGHMHVVNNVCDDEWFLARYDILPVCIDGTIDSWEACYSTFKTLVDEQKNTTHEWTHFDTHFYMCCLDYRDENHLLNSLIPDYVVIIQTDSSTARAQFRRCTLDALFDMPEVCPYEQAVTLQKFSVIVSEGDVYQNCERNMMYSNCPGGDPRPSGKSLAKLMNADTWNQRSYALLNRVSFALIAVVLLLCGLLK